MRKYVNIWILNNTFLNNQWVKEEIKWEIRKILKTNENEKNTCQNLWDAAKAILKGKFIAINSHIEKERSQKNNLNVKLKEL